MHDRDGSRLGHSGGDLGFDGDLLLGLSALGLLLLCPSWEFLALVRHGKSCRMDPLFGSEQRKLVLSQALRELYPVGRLVLVIRLHLLPGRRAFLALTTVAAAQVGAPGRSVRNGGNGFSLGFHTSDLDLGRDWDGSTTLGERKTEASQAAYTHRNNSIEGVLATLSLQRTGRDRRWVG